MEKKKEERGRRGKREYQVSNTMGFVVKNEMPPRLAARGYEEE